MVFRIPNTLGHFRLGITLKSRGSSVERNRIKRVIRESIRALSPALGGFDYNVVVPKGRALSRDYSKSLQSALQKELPRALKNSPDPAL